MSSRIDFGVGYEREEFLRFLRFGFLPDDFKESEEEVDLRSFSVRYTTSVRVLGECESLDLVVFEIEHNSIRDARVSLAKETYKILKNSFNVRALVIYHAKDSENYRFSFLEYSINEDNKRENLNPKRYSYYLGKGIATHTPDKYLWEKGKVTSVEDLRSRFSVEVLTKEFYNELFLWYQWTLSEEANISFPKNPSNEESLDTKIIRLITRIIFVWFIKQKDLVPARLFDTEYLQGILKDFNPLDEKSGAYYNAILQNLFFATLNRAITDEKGKTRSFAKAKGQTDLKTLYRYEEMFSIGEAEVVELFAGVPFLFDCLDKVRRLDGVDKAYYYDGFSRNEKIRTTIPNRLFFDKERGLINIFKRYNFTVEENAPNDIEVSLDPELLGKVFENLLGVYNPETSQTARNATGSFVVGFCSANCFFYPTVNI